MYSKDLSHISKRLCQSQGKHNVILCGFQGVGKTSLGKKLASDLQFSFIDTDQLLQNQHKLNVQELYQQVGEKAFREFEEEVVLSLISCQKHVIALGGGVPLSEKNRTILKKIGVVIYLRSTLEELKSELMSRNPFPKYLKSGNPEEQIRNLYFYRDPIYQEFSDEQK